MPRRSTSRSCSPQNGDGFVFHDRTGQSLPIEANLGLNAFPSPADLWTRYRAWKGISSQAEPIVLQDYYDDGSGEAKRYYQVTAVHRTIEAIAKGANRVLLVMATGSGKPEPPFRSFGACGKQAARNASCSSPTATC